MTAIECRAVTHVYPGAAPPVTALRDVTFSVRRGETVSVCGPSGCGKSTLLSLIAGLQRPTRGQISVCGEPVTAMTERELLPLRAHRIGVVVQNPGRVLLAHSSAQDNVRFARAALDPARRRRLRPADALLDELGLCDLLGRKAGAMSGGEQQRLAVAVALASEPEVLIADEPTSQLDDSNRDAVVSLLQTANEQWGTTVVAVSHDDAVARALGRVIRLDSGAVVADQRPSAVD